MFQAFSFQAVFRPCHLVLPRSVSTFSPLWPPPLPCKVDDWVNCSQFCLLGRFSHSSVFQGHTWKWFWGSYTFSDCLHISSQLLHNLAWAFFSLLQLIWWNILHGSRFKPWVQLCGGDYQEMQLTHALYYWCLIPVVSFPSLTDSLDIMSWQVISTQCRMHHLET